MAERRLKEFLSETIPSLIPCELAPPNTDHGEEYWNKRPWKRRTKLWNQEESDSISVGHGFGDPPVDQSYVRWVPFDGVGRTVRNGLNFTERGFGLGAAVGCSDRGHTAISQLRPGEVDWDQIFGHEGARWFHTGGIFCALSETTPQVALEAVGAAKRNNVVVSYDLNYRESLWKAIGGRQKAQEVNRVLAPHIDVMLGNEEDFSAALGFEVKGLDANLMNLDPARFQQMIAEVVRVYPNLKLVATTLRGVKTASRNDWGAVAYCHGKFTRRHVASISRFSIV